MNKLKTLYIDNMQDNINEIVKMLFSKDYNPPKSIQLELEEESSFIAKLDYDNYMFELMCLITLGGIEYLYGHKDITRLSQGQFNTIQCYINSIGYKIILESNTSQMQITSYRISFERYM